MVTMKTPSEPLPRIPITVEEMAAEILCFIVEQNLVFGCCQECQQDTNIIMVPDNSAGKLGAFIEDMTGRVVKARLKGKNHA